VGHRVSDSIRYSTSVGEPVVNSTANSELQINIFFSQKENNQKLMSI